MSEKTYGLSQIIEKFAGKINPTGHHDLDLQVAENVKDLLDSIDDVLIKVVDMANDLNTDLNSENTIHKEVRTWIEEIKSTLEALECKS